MKLALPRLRILCLGLVTACLCAGCAVGVLLGTLETASTALSLGSLGQTLIEATYVESGNTRVAVAPMPAHYKGNLDKMIREAWEQNYQFVKGVRWEDEDIPWKDLARTALRKARDDNALFVLVEKTLLQQVMVSEEKTFYMTASGKLVREPADAVGENYYPHARTQSDTVALYTYSAYFFTRSRQPSGLLLTYAPRAGPCASGSLVRAVGKKTPGEKAGIRSGDVIASVNGRTADPRTLFFLFNFGANAMQICRDGALSHHTLEIPSPLRKKTLAK